MKTYKIQGEWLGKSAGGCLNHSSWRYNPQVFLVVKEKKSVKIKLSQNGEKMFHIGFYVAKSDGTGQRQLLLSREQLVGKAGFEDQKEVTGSFSLEPSTVPYVVIPCTFNPSEETKFTIAFSSSGEIGLSLLSPANEWNSVDLEGAWTERTAGGCRNFPTCKNNPQYLLKLKHETQLTVILSQKEKSEFDLIGFYIFKTEDSTHKMNNIKTAELVNKSEFESGREACVRFKMSAESLYCIVPCTFDPSHEANFSLLVLSDHAVKLQELKDPQDITVNGEWKDETAGGCVNTPLWRNNPQYFLLVNQKVNVTITLKQFTTKYEYIGFYVARKSANSGEASRLIIFKQDDLVGKGNFAKEKSVAIDLTLEASKTPYVIIPCTFHPNIPGKFSLSVFILGADTSKSALSLLPCNYFGNRKTAKGEWKGPLTGGCRNQPTWLNNPQYSLKIEQNCRLTIILCLVNYQLVEKSNISIGFYILKSKGEVIAADATPELVEKSLIKHAADVHLECDLAKGIYNIIPCTFEPGQEAAFEINVFANGEEEFELEPAGSDFGGKPGRVPTKEEVKTKLKGKPNTALVEKNWEIDWTQLKVFERIGRGGYGVVYKGIYKNQEVAIKKLFREEMGEDDLLNFKKEIELMSRLNNPYIVQFVGASTEYPNICILTEFCHKGSLADLLKAESEETLTWKVKIKMAIDAAKGMLYLHQQTPPIVHRDLKSLNLLVDANYNSRVADFGLSKATTGVSLNSKVGSLNWCAPEVILQNASYTDKADVYSFGMVLWELLTHEAPFSGMHPLQIVRAIDSGDLPPIPKDCNPEFKKLIKDCWATNPKNRPTFSEILEKMQSFINSDGAVVSMRGKK